VSAIPEDCHLCTEISKWWTIMQATVLAKKVLQAFNNIFHDDLMRGLQKYGKKQRFSQ
jgi:hypothetical protein